MEQSISFISEVGFPIVVTMYLLHRIETKLEAVIDSIRTLPQEMKNQ
ncbi:YvrJ family protein [Rossellomorea vietnamensis]|uniref:YvrJ family protein n=2 Tax=Rossellomorea TaxID=2837508 RepID=A0A5D4K8S6_9BACI|nr:MULTISPECIES: YvrJ family protein [Rossellomorea]TYR73436.1 YvrJ family protein [Rossellomorea vietnamensis]TYS75778.1 YvrJ family protein [Rossellomorea aquimaris]TYS75786.1 YvrJ family protein [Rossellomorea aquimaris]